MKRLLLLALLVLAIPLTVTAGPLLPISKVVVFGDSLSDNGNVFAATGFYPPPPYAQRFSNGPTAVEYMAGRLGVPLVNYAYGGATTGSAFFDPDGPGPQIARPNYLNASGLPSPPFTLPNMMDEMGQYLTATGGVSDPTALYVVWGGPNDIFLGMAEGRIPLQIADVINEAVINIVTMTGTLLGTGATFVLVPGMPDLGSTPGFDGVEASGTGMALAFNAALQGALAAYLPAGTWQYYDSFGFLNSVVANPAAYGFTNVTDSCVYTPACVGNPSVWNQYLFWDGVHPTTAAHALLGEEFAREVVPEPASLLLLGTGLIGAVRAVRKRRG